MNRNDTATLGTLVCKCNLACDFQLDNQPSRGRKDLGRDQHIYNRHKLRDRIRQCNILNSVHIFLNYKTGPERHHVQHVDALIDGSLVDCQYD